MREVLAIITILILILPTFIVPDTNILDSRIIDAAFAESSAWMESEIALPRYLSFIRCLIDEWLANNYGKDVDQVRLPKIINTEDWKTYAENEARSRGIILFCNVTPVILSRSYAANELQNKVFAGGCKPGAIGVQSSLSIFVVSKRGFAEAVAKRNYSISVCHPCLYFLIKEAHKKIEKELENLIPDETVVVGVRNDYISAVFLLKSKLLDLDKKIDDLLTSLKREFSSKGIEIEFDVKREISISKSGNSVRLTVSYKFYIEVWDKEVIYWVRGLRKGWYLKNDLKLKAKMLCRVQEAFKRIPTKNREKGPEKREKSRERTIPWLIPPR